MRGSAFTRLVSETPLDSDESGSMRAVRATGGTVQDVQGMSSPPSPPPQPRHPALGTVRRTHPAADRAPGDRAIRVDHRGRAEIGPSVELRRRDRLRDPQASQPEQGHAR